MKKRALSLLLCLVFLVGLMPTTALAAGATGTWAVKLNVSESDAYTYNSRKVLALGFGVQSDDLTVRKAASMVLAVDLEMFDLLKDNDDFSGVENAAGDLTVSLVQASTPIKKGVTIKPSESWNLNVYYAKSADGKFGYIQMIASQDAVDDKVVTAKDLATMYIGFKSGKSVSDLTKNSIRFINAAECALLNQGSAIEITNGKGNMQQAFLKDGSAGTLTVTPAVEWNGITPSEPALPPYSGDIAAPTVNSNAGGKVVLNAVTPTGGPSGATVQYGCSAASDGTGITWQDGTTFNLTVGSTYYFYAKVVETATYAAKVSAASAAVTVADKALTSISITGNATADVPTKDNTTTVTLTATGTYNDGTTDDITAAAAWTVEPAHTGVSVNKGVVTIAPEAAGGKVTIKAEKDGQSKTYSITLNKAISVATSVQVKKDGTVVTTDSIIIPASGSPATTVTYTAQVYDQYGALYTSDTPTWSITSATGVSFDSSTGKVSVDSSALAGDVTLTATSSKDSSKTATVTITLSKKPVHNIGSFANSSVSITYGDAITGQTVGSTTGTVKYESNDPTTVSVDAAGKLTVHKVGNVTITAKVAEDPTYAAASTSYTVTVGQKQLEIIGLTATNREYDTTVNVDLTGGTLSGKVGNDEVDAVIPTTGTMADAKVGDNKPVTVATPSLTGAAAGNYTLKSISGITVNIAQATPKVGTVSYTGSTIYTSTALSAITLSMDGSAAASGAPDAGNLALTGGQTLTPGTNEYDWTFKPNDTTNYKTVTGKVSLTVEEDALDSIAVKAGTAPTKVSYKYKEPFVITGAVIEATYNSGAIKDVTSEVNFSTTLAVGQTSVTVTYQGKTCDITGINVKKADALTSLPDITVSQKNTVTTEQSKDIGRAGMPEDAGTLTYTAGGSSVTTGTATVSSFTVDNTGMVKYTITGDAGAVINLPVTITSDNYENSTVNVVITLTDKNIPTVTANDITVTYDGNAIPNSEITGTADVAGTWEWKSGMAITNVADSGNKTVVFKPTDSANYAEVEKTIKVTINKATPTGEPTYTKITTDGKKLSDAALTNGSITPAGGTIKWDKADTTEVTADTAYGWTYTPTDDANYNKLTGTITPYVVPYIAPVVPAYSVKVAAAENGSVTSNRRTATRGQTVTLTVAPEAGCQLDTLTVTDRSGNAVELTDKGNGTYTFKMPASKVTVTATFKKAPVFTDAGENNWYTAAILWAAEKGVALDEDGSGLFRPMDNCTRADMVTFLWRVAGTPEPTVENPFTDVKESDPWYKAALWAYETGVTKGYGSHDVFAPNAVSGRAQTVLFLQRAVKGVDATGDSFTDVPAGYYYEGAVYWALQNEVTKGYGDSGVFGPEYDCNRAEIITFIYRLYNK